MYNIASGALLLISKATCRPLFLRCISATSPNFGPRFVNNKLTHYQILEIEKDASPEDIRNAFIKLSKDYHPDTNLGRDPQNNHEKFVEINEAYSVLSKPLLRREYDNKLFISMKRYNQHSTTADGSYSSPQYSNPNDNVDYYDPQFYANRDKSQDKYYENKPHYGVKGISKTSNKAVVYICVAIVLVGAVFHFIVVKKLSDIHIENLNARDIKNHQIWVKANDPEYNSEKLRLMKIKMKEEEEKRKKKAGSDD